ACRPSARPVARSTTAKKRGSELTAASAIQASKSSRSVCGVCGRYRNRSSIPSGAETAAKRLSACTVGSSGSRSTQRPRILSRRGGCAPLKSIVMIASFVVIDPVVGRLRDCRSFLVAVESGGEFAPPRGELAAAGWRWAEPAHRDDHRGRGGVRPSRARPGGRCDWSWCRWSRASPGAASRGRADTAHPSAGGRRARRRPSPRCRNRRSSSCARGPTAWPDARRGRGSPSARRRDLDARVARLRLFGPLRPWIKFTSISRILTTKILFDETFLTLEGPISLLVWSHGCVWEYGCPWLLHPSTNL